MRSSRPLARSSTTGFTKNSATRKSVTGRPCSTAASVDNRRSCYLSSNALQPRTSGPFVRMRSLSAFLRTLPPSPTTTKWRNMIN